MNPLSAAVPKLQTLRVFEAAGRLGSFTAAGHELGMTQPAVTQQIRQLESALGMALFDRSSNRVSLNQTGAAFLRAVTDGFDVIARSAEELQGGRATFVLAVNPGIARRWLVPHLTDLHAYFDTIDVRLWLFDRDAELRQNRFDAAIHLSRVAPEGVHSLDLFAEAVTPIASAAFASKFALGPQSGPELLPIEHLLHLDAHDRSWLDWGDWFTGVGAAAPTAKARVLYSNHALLVQDVIAGRGIGLGWRHLIDDHIEQGLIVPVGAEVDRPGSAYRLLWPDSTPNVAIDAIVAFFDSQLEGAKKIG